MSIFTVYPDGWFRGPRAASRAKQHAYEADSPPYRGQMATSFCGVRGHASANEFTHREGNAITCDRCARAASKRRIAR